MHHREIKTVVTQNKCLGVCNTDFSISHGGRNDVLKYHQEAKTVVTQNKCLGDLYTLCRICNTDFSISHGGRNDVLNASPGNKNCCNTK